MPAQYVGVSSWLVGSWHVQSVAVTHSADPSHVLLKVFSKDDLLMCVRVRVEFTSAYIVESFISCCCSRDCVYLDHTFRRKDWRSEAHHVSNAYVQHKCACNARVYASMLSLN